MSEAEKTFNEDEFSEPASLPKLYQLGDDYIVRAMSYDSHGYGKMTTRKISPVTAKVRYPNEYKDAMYFESECYVPSHTDYKPYIGKSINNYFPLRIKPIQGDWSTWDKLIRHIGQDKYKILIDYLIVMFQYPTEKLPIIILVSEENGTGKSTFLQAVAYLLGDNAGVYGQSDLNGQFNGWAMNSLAVFEEISDTKQSINKLKSISTAQMATINRKYMPLFSFEPFVKIMIASNDEETCIQLNENDTRYFVLKIPAFAHFDPDFFNKLKAEAPAMLWYLLNTDPTTKKASRMWFTPEMISTDQLKRIVEVSRSAIYQDIKIAVDEIMTELNLSELRIIRDELVSKLNNRYSLSEISTCLRKEFKIHPVRGRYTPYHKQNTGDDGKIGRYFLFKKDDLCSQCERL